MSKLLISFKLLISLFILSACVEKPSYSGKILSKDLNYDLLNNKKDVIEIMGRPNFIDPIDGNFYYFSEKKMTKNFFTQRLEYIVLTVFNFDNNENVISYKIDNLKKYNDIKVSKDLTKNELVKRGLVEKIFGGIGNQLTPNTSE
jgi:outer membrane protein assembly factor BamE (lipoprotein component of BamABCDE complex)